MKWHTFWAHHCKCARAVGLSVTVCTNNSTTAHMFAYTQRSQRRRDRTNNNARTQTPHHQRARSTASSFLLAIWCITGITLRDAVAKQKLSHVHHARVHRMYRVYLGLYMRKFPYKKKPRVKCIVTAISSACHHRVGHHKTPPRCKWWRR